MAQTGLLLVPSDALGHTWALPGVLGGGQGLPPETGMKDLKIPVWWRRAVLPSLPWLVCFLSFFLFDNRNEPWIHTTQRKEFKNVSGALEKPFGSLLIANPVSRVLLRECT